MSFDPRTELHLHPDFQFAKIGLGDVVREKHDARLLKGRIVHGYAQIPQRGVMKLVPLDGPVLAALTGDRR